MLGLRLSQCKKLLRSSNKYFASVFTAEDVSNVPRAAKVFNGEIGDRLLDVEFGDDDVRRKLLKVREDKAMGADDIAPRLLFHIIDEICRPLWLLFRKSLDEGIVPVDWRRANVSPLHKSGSRSLAGNYRPVSLTSQICKVFESMLRDEMMSHLERFQMLVDSQHGFRKGKSCMTNLLSLLEKVTKCLDDGECVDIIFLDFAKAFDKVPHCRLLQKLESHGISGKLKRWISAWLNGRYQRTCINGCRSGWRRVTSGVPQGSVLGPLLFLIYINDLDSGVMSWILKFADDTKVFRKVCNDMDRSILQDDLDRLIAWSLEWLMFFNEKKCKVMHIGKSNRQFTYAMKGYSIDTVDLEKDLGVFLTRDRC